MCREEARAVLRRGLPLVFAERALRRQDGDDFQRVRIDDQELIADQDVLEAAVFRNDGHDLRRQYRDVNVSRYSRADAHGEVRATEVAGGRRVWRRDGQMHVEAQG